MVTHLAGTEPVALRRLIQNEGMNWIKIILEVVGGLTLFLYGVTRLSESLQEVAGDRMKKLLARFTTHPLAGVARAKTA